MIEVKHLTKRYGNVVAVDDLSFTVEDGQIYGFLGPNGAGKSTTMNILTGYLSAAQGSVCINGYDIFEEPEEAKRQLGYLPEQPPLYQDMRVTEYLNFVADLKKVPKAARGALQGIMATTGLTEVSGRLIRTLSKGYRQRVGIAQALVGDPPIIILDEPTVGLDPLQMIEIRNLIRDLAKTHTVILSSHILSEVSNVCDKVLIIAKGRLVAQDTPENLSRHMCGANTYQLTVRGKAETVRAALKPLPLDKIELETAEDGDVRVKLECPAQTDPRCAVFYALAKADCPILEESVTTLSLEQVFLELTTAEEPAAAPKKPASKSAVSSEQKKAVKSENADAEKQTAAASPDSQTAEPGAAAQKEED